jgi:hypothetical protein
LKHIPSGGSKVAGSFHERFDRPEPPLPPDRSTGLVFAVVALVVALFWRSNVIVMTIALALAATLAAVSFVAPSILKPLNVAWMRVALLLSKLVRPGTLQDTIDSPSWYRAQSNERAFRTARMCYCRKRN